MDVQPVALRDANAAVAAMHRHSRPVTGHLFSLGLFDGWEFCGAVITGRPVARGLQDGATVEITRCVTDGTRNACSKLYAAACREAKRRGYRRVITYTLATESGASLKASGFAPVAEVKGRQWHCPSRPRETRAVADRVRWERTLT